MLSYNQVCNTDNFFYIDNDFIYFLGNNLKSKRIMLNNKIVSILKELDFFMWKIFLNLTMTQPGKFTRESINVFLNLKDNL